MAFITKYETNLTKDQIVYALQNIPQENVLIVGVKEFTIGDFYISPKEDGFIYGKIVVKRKFEDYNFKRDEDYEIEKTPQEYYIYDEVGFTIFPDLRIISFASKSTARLFGINILSRVLFGDTDKIGNVLFYPQKVLEAKDKGLFQNVWFNGVRCDSNIQYSGQFGNEIDEDIGFLDEPDRRMGIGVVLVSKTGYTLKVAVYLEGTLLCHSKLKDPRDNIIVNKEIITNFLPYSNFNEKIPAKIADSFVSLQDFMN